MKKAVILLILLFGTGVALAQPAATRLTLADLKDEVTVRRDSRGIPYIEAKNDHDLYFAQGYIAASDRLFQMDLMRRLARGETAEIFGAQALEQDKRWRRFAFAEVANQSLGQVSPELREALNAYANGVNAYLAGLKDEQLPPECRILQYRPRQWGATDTILIGKILSDSLSTTWQNDILRASIQGLSKEKFEDITNQVTPNDVVLFGKDTAPARAERTNVGGVSDKVLAAVQRDSEIREQGLTEIGLFAEGLAASNNFVVSGNRTADGKPLLENDPHLSPTAPGIWYLTELSTPTMHAAGVTFPGVPGIVLGHNDYFAWGATNVGPDVQDLYVETFNDQGEYKTPTGWQKPTVRHEEIKVRANPLNPATRPVAMDVTETRNGVIIVGDDGKQYALKWTARDPKNNEFEAFFAANRAKGWDGFKNALRSYGGATQNFVYADVKGNIGWYAAGRIPIRKTGDGRLPYDGSTTDGDWIGYIPFDELPNLYNPPSGVIVTANQRIVGTSYKYTQMSQDAGTPWRARRILDLLDAKKKVTMDDVRDIEYDVFNRPLDDLAKEIVKTGAASPETLAVLKDWDGKMTADSRGSILANEIRTCVAGKMADSNKPAPMAAIRERVVDWAIRDHVERWLPIGFSNYADLLKSCDASIRTSLADAKRLGPDPMTWTWGRIFVSRFPHPLASAPLIGAQFVIPAVPLNGSGNVPNVGSSVSMRHISSPGNWDATRFVIPLGESGDPRSPHFKDEFNAWRTGTPMVFPFSKEAVANATKETWILSPR